MAAIAGQVRVLQGCPPCPAEQRRVPAKRHVRPRYGLRRMVVVLVALAVAAPLLAVATRAADSSPTAGGTAPVAAAPSVPGWARASAAKVVVVAPGDTVWDLALAHRPPGVDATDWVALVVKDNHVDAAALRPGAVLRLPASPR